MRLNASLLRHPGQLATGIAGLIAGESVAKEVSCARQRLRNARHYFVYDWTGATFDAFSALMVEVILF